MINITKINRFDAYEVDTDIGSLNYIVEDDYSKYIRISPDLWIRFSKSGNIADFANPYQVKDLEQAFKETNSVMHEQLSLL